MSKDQKGFITYGDFEAVADELTNEQLGQLFRAKLNYFNTGKAPKFDGILKYVWIPIQQQMDRDSENYEKKCAKMRENANKRWSKSGKSDAMQLHANDANTNTKTNTDTKTDTDTDTMSAETDASSLALSLIEYLNEKAGTDYELNGSITERIQVLLIAGYTPDQMRTVIDKKCAEWLGDEKMRGYLRPSTLFGDKFWEYLSSPVSLALERERETSRKKSELRWELEEKKTALNDLRDSLKGADPKERRILREQIAILEDSIGLIERRLA